MALSADASATPEPVIAIVVGEESGDILGADLMRALRSHFPNARFEGIGGPRMCALGFHSFFPQDRLAVMGLIDPLKRLPELLRIRRHLKRHFESHKPLVFIGIDSPDFNLNLEKYLRARGVKTVHYVSPSVWAWRQGRIKTIARAVDLMLTLLPFEKRFYDEHGIRAEFVGHPLADRIPLQVSREAEALALGFAAETEVIALLPGSRSGEVERLAPVFLDAARLILQSRPKAEFVMPAANAGRLAQLNALLEPYSDLPVRLIDGHSHQAMAASHAVLMASGTTTLESLLLKRPMVIAYKMADASFWVMKRLAKTPYIGLPNLLSAKPLVPELLQEQATALALSQAVLHWLESPEEVQQLKMRFDQIHCQLKRNASRQAAMHVHALIHQ